MYPLEYIINNHLPIDPSKHIEVLDMHLKETGGVSYGRMKVEAIAQAVDKIYILPDMDSEGEDNLVFILWKDKVPEHNHFAIQFLNNIRREMRYER